MFIYIRNIRKVLSFISNKKNLYQVEIYFFSSIVHRWFILSFLLSDVVLRARVCM